MKIVALIGAALLAAGTFATAPAEAQPRYGYGHDRHDRGWRDDRGWRGDRHGWRGDRRDWRGGPRARSRVVCRVQRGYYGPVRRCFRVWR